MKKQALKAITMLVVIIVLAFASALASAANAQTRGTITVNIPFEFNVGDKVLPAGQYNVQHILRDDAGLLIQKRDGIESAIVITTNIQTSERRSETELVFKKYGERYFLSQVWTSGMKDGRELFKYSAERALELELAKKATRAETVTIAANLQ